MRMVVIVPVQWVKALPYSSKANIQICILNISSCAKKISFAPVMFLIMIMIMAMDIYITLVLKQRGEHELK